jgi:hypothetical protein
MTIATWWKCANYDGRKFLAGKGNADYDATTGYAWGISATTADLYLNVSNVQYTGLYTVPANKWVHLAVVFDTTNNLVNAYVDGNLVKSSAATAEISTNTDDFTIGKMSTQGQYDTGSRFDTAIWNTALTPLQIKSLALGVDLSSYAYRPSNVSTQPTHWWKLNEVSGNRADSVSTNPLTLTDNNTVLSSGGYVEGVGAKFVAANSEYFTVPDSADFNFGSSDFTIRIRVQHTDASATTQGGYFCQSLSNNFFNFYAVSGVLSAYGQNVGTPIINAYCTFVPVVGVWYDIVLVRRSNDVEMWIDGVSQSMTVTTPFGTIPDIAADPQIGHDLWNGYYSSGVFEDLAIWKGYALSSAEIKSLACALPIQRQGIVSYWDMNGADGAGETDRIGANNLTHVAASGTIGSVTGMVGNARDFEDSAAENQSLKILDGSQTGLELTTEQFLCGWVKLESDGANRFTIYKDGAAGSRGYQLGYYTSGTTFRYTLSDDGTNLITSDTTFAPSTGVWYFLAGNFDMANMAVWVDAIQYDLTAKTTGVVDSTNDFFICPANMDGVVDEYLACKRYFRPEEIKAVYLKGLNGKEATSSESGEGGTSDFIYIRLPLLGIG